MASTVARPTNIPLPFASSGTKNTIPVSPATTPGLASFTTGFPSVTMQPIAAGGIPPEGQDFNGILYDITSHTVWINAGGQYQYDTTIATAIGGYPQYAMLQSATTPGLWWLNLVNGNTMNPDAGGSGWQPMSFGQTYAGSPNGKVAGVAASQYGIAQSLVWDTTDNVLWLCTTSGTAATAAWTSITGAISGLSIGVGLQNLNGSLAISGPTYVNSPAVLSGGAYLVDTSVSGFNLTLPPAPSKVTMITFCDAAATWGVNNWTLLRNGKTIMGQSADLIVNLSDQQFSIWFNGSDWRLV